MMPDVPVLLLIPPLTQLNTPYPSTAYLTGFLRAHGYTAAQADVGIEMVLALFSRAGLSRVFEEIKRMAGPLRGEVRQMLVLERAYLDSIEPVVAFLQGQDATLAPLICRGRLLPQGPRFAHASFSKTGSTIDDARHLATLYLEDLTDLIHETVATHFALSLYAQLIGTSATSFETVARALSEPLHFTDELMLEAVWRHVESINPLLVGLTVPFPGNLYGAFRIAQSLKNRLPSIKIALGGGYANTELRRLQDPRVFDYLDYVTLDDGERPLLCLVEHLMGKRNESDLCRTFMRTNGRVRFQDGCREPDFSMAELSAPTDDSRFFLADPVRSFRSPTVGDLSETEN
ncbi:MAG: hypothetical protein ICV76_04070 [Nitrospiraceae bacterium]|nr:hypothetical protein [Nitrospiraceae bacterium]